MGRYYSGDIEGKFMFAVQSSTDASNFGGYEKTLDDCVEYVFTNVHKDEIDNGIEICLAQLGDYKQDIDQFFVENEYYNDEALADYLEILDKKKVKELLVQYARLRLGLQIKDCVDKTGRCEFLTEQ